MTIPKSFKFYGKTWTVTRRAPPDDRRPNAWGMTDLKRQHIYLDPNLGPEVLEQTFLHECLHIIFSEQGLDVALEMDGDAEEKVVNALANGFYLLLKSGLLKYVN